MPPVASLLSSLTLLLCGVVLSAWAVDGGDSAPGYESLQDLRYRDTQTEPRKPVRDDGLGSLLLKNLRFRDLTRRTTRMQPSFALWGLRHQNTDDNDFLPTDLEDSPNSIGRGVSKRQSQVDVSQLAQLLSDLKARNVDDGVKLQSLRFGRRRR